MRRSAPIETFRTANNTATSARPAIGDGKRSIYGLTGATAWRQATSARLAANKLRAPSSGAIDHPCHLLVTGAGLISQTFLVANDGTGDIRHVDPATRRMTTIVGGFTIASVNVNTRGPEQMAYNRAWTDHRGDFLTVVDRDALPTNVTIYWVSGDDRILHTDLSREQSGWRDLRPYISIQNAGGACRVSEGGNRFAVSLDRPGLQHRPDDRNAEGRALR